MTTQLSFRFGEDEILREVEEYIANTYKGHYVGKQQIQTIDVWDSLNIAPESCVSNILKYTMRYGKKKGYNKADLLKIIHYTVLLWHFTQEKQGNEQ